jgi:tRNA pseudouridine55 synthase
LQPFIGDILQAPPAYSAIKQDGVPLHRRARRGEIITPEPRPVTIYGIEMLSWQAPCLTVEVTCAAGTYIRSLAHDLGQSLGCGAALSGLVRTRSGIFMVEESIELDALAEAERAGELSRHLHPLAVALKDLTPAPVRAAEVERLRNGLPIDGTLLNGAPINKAPDAPGAGLTGYAIGEDGQVVAILTYDPAAFQWRPEKVFATE